MTLESTFSLGEEAEEGGDGPQGQEVQPPVSGELGMVLTLAVEIVQEEEEEAKEEEADQEDTDMNDLLNDLEGGAEKEYGEL